MPDTIPAIYETLESAGLRSETDLPTLDSIGKKQLVRLYSQLFSLIYDDQNSRPVVDRSHDELDPFRFIASASLRGASGCAEPGCQIKKLDLLGRYAALYANHVAIPLPMVRSAKLESVNDFRQALAGAALILLRLRPVFTGGIAAPTVMVSQHCVHTIKWVDEMTELVHQVADDAADLISAEFKVEYQLPDKSPSGRSTVYLEGSTDFIDHGSLVFLFDESGNFRQKSWRFDKHGKTELKGEKKAFFLKHILHTIAEDTTFYLAYGRYHEGRLLTDRKGDTFLLAGLPRKDQMVDTSSAMGMLSHAVPLVSELPLSTLVRIREQERDAFESYRIALSRITNDILTRDKAVSGAEASELLRAEIQPRLAKLKNEVNAERKRQRNRVIAGSAALAAGVAIGAFGHLPFAATASLTATAAATGARLLGKAAESACEHGANLAQQDDLYFILRLMQEEHYG